MPTIKTIKPGGGGDYTSLQAWWNVVKTAGSADQWAECYGGDLGNVNLAGYTFTPDSTHYVRIYAVEQHQGTVDTTKAYINNDGTVSAVIIPSNLNFTRVEGILFKRFADGTLPLLDANSNVDNIRVIGNLFYDPTPGTAGSGPNITFASVNVQDLYIINNIFYKSPSSGTVECIGLLNGASNNRYHLYNNFVYNTQGVNVKFYNAAATVMDSKNNIYLAPSANFSEQVGGSSVSPTLSSSTNDYMSGTAIIWSTYTNCLTSQSSSGVVSNLASDWKLIVGSPAVDAGVTVGFFSTDAFGTVRPQGSAWDIGPHELTPMSGPETYPEAVLRITPKAYYRQNDIAGIMSDSTPHFNNGTHNEFVIHGQSALIRSSTDASSQHTLSSQSTVPAIINEEEMSFEFWMVANTFNAGKVFSFNGEYGKFEPFSEVSGRARFTYGGKYVDSLTPLESNKIYYVVAIINRGTLKLYINNQFQGTAVGAFKLYRILSVNGPLSASTSFTTLGEFEVGNFAWIAAASEEEAVKQAVYGTATVLREPRFPDGSYNYPDSLAFRYYLADTLTFDPNFGYLTIPGHSIVLEDIYGLAESDNDYNDVYWQVEVESVGEANNNNLIGVQYLGLVDEFAIYSRELTAAEIAYHWLLGYGVENPSGVADVIAFIETLGVQKIYSQSLSESLTFTDVSGSIQKLEQSIAFSEQVARQLIGTSAVNETLAFAELYGAELTGGTMHVGDLLFFNDFAEGFTTKVLAENIVFTESVATPGLAYASVSNEITFTESVIFQIPGKHFRSVSDTLLFNDSVSYTTSIHAFSLTDTLTFTESISFTAPYVRDINETFAFTDSVRKNLNVEVVQEAMTFFDSVRKNLNVFQGQETFNFTESIRVSPIKASVTDTFGPFVETATVITNHQRLEETFEFAETVIEHLSVINQTLTDLFEFTESAQYGFIVANMSFTEQLVFTESLKRIIDQSVSDTITFTEQLARMEQLLETITFTETVTATASKVLRDTILFLEAICVCFTPSRVLTDTITFVETLTALKNNQNNLPPVPVNGFNLGGVYKIKLTEYIRFTEMVKLPMIYDNCCMRYLDTINFTDSGAYQLNAGPVVPF